MISWLRELGGLFDRLRDIHGLLIIINWRTKRMGAEFDLLKTEVAETRAAVVAAVAGIADLKTKLDEALAAAGNPAEFAAMAADLDALQADLINALAPPPVA